MTENPATWARAKVARARQHALDLEGRILSWVTTSGINTDASIAEDRLSWELRLTAFDPPPLPEWALIVGDSLHNLRSALDVLVWAHVDETVLTVPEAKRVAYPVHMERAKWDSDTRVLPVLRKALPADVLRRVEESQPFQRPESERDHDPLPLLNSLDNQDKHRLALAATTRVEGMQYDHMIEFEDEAAGARNVPPDVTIHDLTLASGAPLMSGTTIDRIARVGGSHRLEVKVGILVDGQFYAVLDLINGLIKYVNDLVGYVTHGELPAAEPNQDGPIPA